MADRKQVNVNRLSPAFFWKTSPTCSVLNAGRAGGPSREDNQEPNRSVLEGETVTFKEVWMSIFIL